jgi:hypothetical protein
MINISKFISNPNQSTRLDIAVINNVINKKNVQIFILQRFNPNPGC